MDANGKPLGRGRQITLRVISILWATIIVLSFTLPKPPFNLEVWLWRHFPTGRADQYGFVNRLINPPIAVVLVTWFSVSIGLLVAKRYKRFLINVSGPLVASLMVVPAEDFRDPQWFTIGAVFSIGCIVGLFVSGIPSLGNCFGSRCRTKCN